MRIGITGYEGQIGRRLVSLFGIPLKLQLLDKDSIYKEIKFVRPDVIIHCAGISSIEECQKDYDKAMEVNVWGTRSLCEVAENKVILLSSEQVFDGTNILNTETDEPNPINTYGLSKYAAEGVVQAFGGKVIRLSRGFSNRVGSDVFRYTQLLRLGEVVSVPSFIYRNYSHLNFVSIGIWEYARMFNDMPNILNIGGSEVMSFYALMKLIARNLRTDRSDQVVPRNTPEPGYPPRPFRSGLNVSLAKSLGIPIYEPERSVELFLKEKQHE